MDNYEIEAVKQAFKDGRTVLFRGAKVIAFAVFCSKEMATLEKDEHGHILLQELDCADFTLSDPLFREDGTVIQDVYRIFYDQYAGEDDRNYRITRTHHDDVYGKDGVSKWLTQLKAEQEMELLAVDPRWRNGFDNYHRTLIEVVRIAPVLTSDFSIDLDVVDKAVKEESTRLKAERAEVVRRERDEELRRLKDLQKKYPQV